MGAIVIGSEAINRGETTRHELARWYRSVYPGVYVPKQAQLKLRDRTVAAYLWSRRGGVIAGVAASALHGARWVDDGHKVELIWGSTRPPNGISCRDETLAIDEATRVAGIPVTSLTRTAFDLGRHLPRSQAIARLDALMRATPFELEDVRRLALRHRGVRGLRRLKAALPLIDAGAASPKETWLRLLLIDAGLPTPTTQIPVHQNWNLLAVLDMGWDDFLVAAEYDGDQHRTDRRQYVKDRWRLRKLRELGWIVVTVIAEDRPDDVVARVRAALLSRGWRPSSSTRCATG